MSRTVTSDVAAAIVAPNVAAITLVEMDFASGLLNVSSAPFAITAMSKTWVGVGNLGKISGIDETTAIEAHGITVEMSGIDPANISTALGQHYQGRRVQIWLAILNPDTHVLINDPIPLWVGRMDTMNIELGETATITLTAESRLADLRRPRARRYNSADQQIMYPDDLGFDYVPLMVSRELPWGV